MAKVPVTLPSENPLGDCPAVMVGDPSENPRGLIVLHEWWGMNEHIQEETANLAKQGGFTGLVIDFYRGKVAIDRETAGHYMSGLDWTGAEKDLRAGARYLLSKGCRKVGVVGFCMGGALAFLGAANVSEISAASPFYGICSDRYADLTKITIPVQAHFAQHDEVAGFSSPKEYGPLNERLLAAGVPYEVYIYPTGHAFANKNAENYNKEATDLAYERLFTFMKANL